MGNQCEVNGRIITIEEQRGFQRGFQRRPRIIRRNNQRRRRPPRQRPEERDPSPTMIFVSNIPFSLSDEEFKAIFDGYQVEKAFVAVTRNGRSKGFGFVDFKTNEDQQRAIKELQDVESKGRKLAIRVAYKAAKEGEGNVTTDNNSNDNKEQNN